MTLQITTVLKDTLRREIIVDFENIDKQLSIHIPLSEYKQWCKLNDLDHRDDHCEDFAREYLDGVINTDETAQLMLREICALFNIDAEATYTFKCEEKWYTIVKGRQGYRLFQEDKRQTNFLIKELYKAVMRSIDKPVNLN